MEKNTPHFTVLLVPSDNKRVREFRLTYTTAVLVPVLIVCLILAFVLTYARSSGENENLLIENEKALEDAKTAKDENILLQAEIEELNGLLTKAQTTLDEKNAAEAILSEENTKKSIPDAFPVAGGVGVPTEYTEQNPFIQFTVGEKTRIIATAAGNVASVTETVDGANEIKVDHGNGYVSTYTCKGMAIVNVGDAVIRTSTLILSESAEGAEENIVLTYQLEFNGVSIDPMSMIEVNG